ncbi:MAG: GNAT family N-acetyltransferase [Solirubrobacteraceae bacterium]|nr:GNAT family N-acetyltransferase [Solirubrobacteraceae bacterium]
MAEIRFVSDSAAQPPGSTLVAAMVEELIPLYGRIDVPGAPSATPADFAPPGGDFLIGFDGATVVCCGGLKRLDDEACEIKRMFVVPEARGRGVAGELLVALEDRARAMGYTIARLDTGPKQPHAERMYRAAGYTPIGNFNANPFASFWGEKEL